MGAAHGCPPFERTQMLYFRKWIARRGYLKPLIVVLKNKNPELRLAGTLGLAGLASPEAAPPLATMLEDELESIRLAAAKGLGKFSHSETVDPLKKALHDEKLKVRLAAARSLKAYNPPECLWGHSILIGEGGKEERLDSKSIIRKTGDPAGEPLIGALASESWQIRASAAEMLGEIKYQKATEPLVGLLGDPDVDTRHASTIALGKLENEWVSDKFVAMLNDAREDLGVRCAAAESLTVFGTSEGLLGHIWMMALGSERQKIASRQIVSNAGLDAMEPAVHALKKGYWSVQKTAADLMGQLQDEQCVEPLLPVALNNKPQVRLAVAEALGKLGNGKAIKMLLAMLGDSDWKVRAAAAHSVSQIKIAESKNPTLIDNYGLSEGVMSSSPLGESGKSALETLTPLIALMRDGNENVRAAAAEALGDIGEAAAVEPLCKGLKDLSDKVRAASAGALGKLKDHQAFEPLIGALNDWYSTVCNAAALSLVQLGPPVDLWGHGWLIGGGTDQEKATSKKIINKAGMRAFEPLRAAIKDWSSEVRAAAALAFGDLKHSRSVETLCKEVVRSPLDLQVIQAVFTALAKLALPGTGEVIGKALIEGKFQVDDKPLIKRILKYCRLMAQAPWMTKEDKMAIIEATKKLLELFGEPTGDTTMKVPRPKSANQ